MDEAKARALADRLVVDVCELPNRTSPEDWPEAMLVTGEELHAMVMDRLIAFATEVRRDEREKALVAVLRLTADDTAKYGGRQAAIDAIRALPPQAEPDPMVALEDARVPKPWEFRALTFEDGIFRVDLRSDEHGFWLTATGPTAAAAFDAVTARANEHGAKS